MADAPKVEPKGPTTTTSNKAIPEDFSLWGGLADTAKGQGFYPAQTNNDFVEYRNKYGLFNIVNVPNTNQKGYLSVVGNRSNGTFNIMVKDALGRPLTTVANNISPQEVNKYFAGIVGHRTGQIADGTNPDKVVNGHFAGLYK
jgi:hypothetical protein